MNIYDFHIFPVIYLPLHGFIRNQHDDQLPVGFLALLVELKSHAGLNFFQALLSLVFITAKITFIFTSLSVYSSNIRLSYKRREYI